MVLRKTISNKSICHFVLLLSLLLVLLIIGCKSKESYKRELEQKGIPYSAESFLNRAGAGSKDTIKLFLRAGMDVNARGNNGETALMQAVINNNVEIVELLIKKRADMNAKNDDGYTALIIASFKGYTDIMNLLIGKGADMNAKNNNGETALMLASLNDQGEAVKMLIKKGADVNAANNKGETALKYAFLNIQIQELLRKAGAK